MHGVLCSSTCLSPQQKLNSFSTMLNSAKLMATLQTYCILRRVKNQVPTKPLWKYFRKFNIMLKPFFNLLIELNSL